MILLTLVLTLLHADSYDDRLNQRREVWQRDELARQYEHYQNVNRKYYQQVLSLIAQGGGERLATVCTVSPLECSEVDYQCRGSYDRHATTSLEGLLTSERVVVDGCRIYVNRGNLDCGTYRNALKDWNTLYATCVGPDPRSPGVTLATGGATGKRKRH